MKFHLMDKVRVKAPEDGMIITLHGKFPEQFYNGWEGYIYQHTEPGADGSAKYGVWFKFMNDFGWTNLVNIHFHESNLELVERGLDNKELRQLMEGKSKEH